MKTGRIAHIDIDSSQLASDLIKAEYFNYDISYQEFACGSWRSCMLWNKSGRYEDGHLSDHSDPAIQTEYGHTLKYISQLISQIFKLDLLRFARLVKLSPNSVLIPHRDYLELKQEFYRIHIPLQTNENCFNSEENIVYHMKEGEIWFIDATKIHSAASFSKTDRIHLILDFVWVEEFNLLLKNKLDSNPIMPNESIVQRSPFTIKDEKAIRSLHKIIDLENYKDILALLIKKYFRKEMTASSVFDWLIYIANQSKNSKLIEKIIDHKNYYLISR